MRICDTCQKLSHSNNNKISEAKQYAIKIVICVGETFGNETDVIFIDLCDDHIKELKDKIAMFQKDKI